MTQFEVQAHGSEMTDSASLQTSCVGGGGELKLSSRYALCECVVVCVEGSSPGLEKKVGGMEKIGDDTCQVEGACVRSVVIYKAWK